MGFGYFPYAQGAVNPYIYDANGQQLIGLSHALGVTEMVGAEATGDDLEIKANSIDDYSKIFLTGDGWLALYAHGGISFYEQAVAMLQTTHASNVTTVKGGITAGDHLVLKANSTDDYPLIDLIGSNNLILDSYGSIQFRKQGTARGYYYFGGTDFSIRSYDNANIEFEPNGTGLVKFGAYTAGAATDSTGYISILDAAGNARKLMVQT